MPSTQNAAAANDSDQSMYVQHLKSELRKMQAMAALGELTSTATHEFNNVLMTILNYARLGIRNTDDATRDKALRKILEASERAAKITNTILAQARNRSDSHEPTDLTEIIESSLVLLEREMRKYRIAVETDLDSECAARDGQWQPDPTRAVEPADQRPTSDARRRHDFGSVGC